MEVGSYDPAYPVDKARYYFVLAFRLKPEIETATGSFRSELEDFDDLPQARSKLGYLPIL